MQPLRYANRDSVEQPSPQLRCSGGGEFAADLEAAGLHVVIEAEVSHMQRLERAIQNGRLEANVGAVLGVR